MHSTRELLAGNETVDPRDKTIVRLWGKVRRNELDQLDNLACINAYTTSFQSTYSSLLLVTDDVNGSYPQYAAEMNVTRPKDYDLYNQGPRKSPYSWICGSMPLTYDGPYYNSTCDFFLSTIRTHADEWTVRTYRNQFHRIKHCLIETAPENCTLELSLPLAVAVVVVNLIKAIMMLYVALSAAEAPILTIGDAIASFIRVPDPSQRVNAYCQGS